jgi:hypothetical protein
MEAAMVSNLSCQAWLDDLLGELRGSLKDESAMKWFQQAKAGDYFLMVTNDAISWGVFSNVPLTGVGEFGSIYGLAETGKHQTAWLHSIEKPLGKLVLVDVTKIAGFISRELFFKAKSCGFAYKDRHSLAKLNKTLFLETINGLSKSPYRAEGSS